jgi:YhcH/YjgK/YiaL family protein
MILDNIEHWKLYAGLGEGIARGLELLAKGELDALPEGKHELDGKNLYASVQAYHPKAPLEGRWEAHRQYIDIQYLVTGCEAMGYCPSETLQAVEAYDARKDVRFFGRGPEAGTVLKVETKMFAVFFPQDAHMPMLSLEAFFQAAPGGPRLSEDVKKIVLKVAVALKPPPLTQRTK